MICTFLLLIEIRKEQKKLAKEAEENGVQVIIALAGMAAALPGIIAAMVTISSNWCTTSRLCIEWH